MKRRILALLLMAVMLLGLAACSTGGTKVSGINFEVPEVGYDGSEVNLVFYHTMGQNLRDVLDLYIAEFNALYPNITIDVDSH